jgi:serine/threonine protein kinase
VKPKTPSQGVHSKGTAKPLNTTQCSRIGDYFYFTPAIGKGSYSKVFIGQHVSASSDGKAPEPAKYVAIKRVNASAMKKISLARIQREIDLLKGLDHPNIVKFHEAFTDIAQNVYIVTEYCLTGDTRVNMNGWSMRLDSLIQEHSDVPLRCPTFKEEKTDAAITGQMIMDNIRACVDVGEKDCVRLTFEDGRQISCTSNHRFMTTAGWVEAGQLRERGCDVLFGSDYPEYILGLTPSEKMLEEQWILEAGDETFIMDSWGEAVKSLAFSRILGYMLTDGSIGDTYGSVSLGHVFDVDQFVADVKLLTGTEPKCCLATTVGHREDGTCFESQVYHLTIPKTLAQCIRAVSGFPTGNRHDTGYSIPTFLMNDCPKLLVRAFLSGVFGGDGGTLSMSSVSLEMSYNETNATSHAEFMKAIQTLLYSAGVPGSTIHTPRKIKQSYYTTLTVPTTSLVQFGDFIGFAYCCHKQTRLSPGVAAYRRKERRDSMNRWVYSRYKEAKDALEGGRIPNGLVPRLFAEWDSTNDFTDIKGRQTGLHFRNIYPRDYDELRGKDVDIYGWLEEHDAYKFFKSGEDDGHHHYVVPRSDQGPRPWTMKVINVKPIGKQHVYDLQMSDKSPSFMANGAIVHNCNFGDLAKYTGKVSKDGSAPLRLTHAEILEYMRQLRNGLRYLLTHNILHRDLKPQNILLQKDSVTGALTVKIADFGFAKHFETMSEDSMLQTLCGTPMYLAPEIIKERKCTIPSDLWSLGVIIYELFFHTTPFKRPRNILELVRSVEEMTKHPPTMTGLGEDVSDLLERLLEVDPHKRITWGNYFTHPWFGDDDLSATGIDESSLIGSVAGLPFQSAMGASSMLRTVNSLPPPRLTQESDDEDLDSPIPVDVHSRPRNPNGSRGKDEESNRLDDSNIADLARRMMKLPPSGSSAPSSSTIPGSGLEEHEFLNQSSRLYSPPVFLDNYLPFTASFPTEIRRYSHGSGMSPLSLPASGAMVDPLSLGGARPIPIPPGGTLSTHRASFKGSPGTRTSGSWGSSPMLKFLSDSVGSSISYIGSLSPVSHIVSTLNDIRSK